MCSAFSIKILMWCPFQCNTKNAIVSECRKFNVNLFLQLSWNQPQKRLFYFFPLLGMCKNANASSLKLNANYLFMAFEVRIEMWTTQIEINICVLREMETDSLSRYREEILRWRIAYKRKRITFLLWTIFPVKMSNSFWRAFYCFYNK